MSVFQVVIETPKDSREKYNFDEKTGSFLLKKLLPLGMAFPFNFGFIPGTKGEDGDPLDAMVISELRTFPGCRLNCRLIGMLQAKQSKGKEMIRNDRYFFVPETSLLYDHIKRMGDFSSQLQKELLSFFVNYNKEEGTKFEPVKIEGAGRAQTLLRKQVQPLHKI